MIFAMTGSVARPAGAERRRAVRSLDLVRKHSYKRIEVLAVPGHAVHEWVRFVVETQRAQAVSSSLIHLDRTRT
jgi:hypothetical protein